MSEVQGTGLAGLEKELACSICTELLYQPLTLLDCLHTFCGSCLKEWFSAQGSRRRHSGSAPRFTCPSCRAEVRETRPNATVTTLLDMVLMAHPDRDRSAEEKDEIAQRYKPGDSVTPLPQSDEDSEDDEDDRRVLEEIRELSLRENRAQGRREARRAAPERTREGSSNPERHADDGRSQRRREDASERQRTTRPQVDSDRTRQVEHQSSLRSLLSMSETQTIEEEILQQIIEEGLLDDIDLDNVDPTQEEELTERIADAYRRRHMRQSHPRQEQRRRQSPERSARGHSRSQSAQRPTETSTTTRDPNDRRPPISRPHLLDSTTASPPQHRRRNSEQASGPRRTSPVRINQGSTSEDAIRPAVRSSSDMTAEQTRSSQNGRARASSSSNRPRRATESDPNISDVWMGAGRERGPSRHITSQSATNSPTLMSSPTTVTHSSIPNESAVSNLSSPLVPPRSERRNRPSSSRLNAPASQNIQYAEPAISCDSCGKANIQYDLHMRCLKCKDGNYHLCLRCYRSGKGCLLWEGFRSSAQKTFDRVLASSNHRSMQPRETRHILISIKYERPSETAHVTTSGDRQITNDNPARRMGTGFFCAICQSSANDCFWKCGQCNEGDWGFCNRCVNQGRCCTHPLLPIRRMAGSPATSAPTTSGDTIANTSVSFGKESYKILSFSTKCDICTYPIPASVTRFHCLQCNDGDYDVCTNCYLKLVATSKISKENGHNGWRRCLSGHRLIVVGFDDSNDGQRRAIVRDLVGGHALKDEHVNRSPSSSPATGPIASPKIGTAGRKAKNVAKRLLVCEGPIPPPNSNASADTGTQPGTPTSQHAPSFRRFPPDGGVGLVVHALWSYYPDEEVQDELFFPRGADIKEVENINDDWFWGCYAGRTGLFPGAHVAAIAEIA
ncbi:hypothetical protein N7448_001154 [Penicillium atrosanguineum]|nr:hypothetical protein N7448_001154 [Penicillium atrosanguineum]